MAKGQYYMEEERFVGQLQIKEIFGARNVEIVGETLAGVRIYHIGGNYGNATLSVYKRLIDIFGSKDSKRKIKSALEEKFYTKLKLVHGEK